MLLSKLLVSFSGPLLNTNAKSSAKNSFSGDPDKIYLDSASITMINNIGFNTEPWCNTTWTKKSFLEVSLTLTRLWTFLYIDFIVLTNPSSTPSFLKAPYATSLRTRSKAFSKSINAMHGLFFFAKYFSYDYPQNENDIYSSTSWHEIKLHLTNIHLLPYKPLKNSFLLFP